VTTEKNSMVYALVLAGGRSRRMGEDKAALVYRGKSQLAHTLELANKHSESLFISLRENQEIPQEADVIRAGIIHDRFGEIGPLGGILSAMDTHRDVGWLILAVDLPFITDNTLYTLLAQRDPSALFTAYRSSYDGLPEPLCALYEPAARPILLDSCNKRGISCPRKMLIDGPTHLLKQPEPGDLDNINTPGDHRAALQRMGS